MADTIKFKPLNTQHFWQVVSMIRKGGKDAILKLQDVGKIDDDTDKKAADMMRGLLIFDVAMEHAERELKTLFADIANMTVEEYEAAPWDTTLDIIEHLAEHENLADFFKRAANFVKKFLPAPKAKA